MSVSPRLLLATDDGALARTLSWVLKENGYEITTAVGIDQLRERCDQEEYDLRILDIGSAGQSADVRMEIVRSCKGRGDTPLLVLSDTGIPPERTAELGLDGSDLVPRPHRVRELLARIKAHLRMGRELNRARAEARSRSKLVEILKELGVTREPHAIYQILVRGVAQGLGIARCSIVMGTPGDDSGVVVAAFENPMLRDLKVDLSRYPEIARALSTGETVMVNDIENHPLYEAAFANWGKEIHGSRTGSVIALPFALDGRIAGVFFLRTTADDPPLNHLDLGFAQLVIDAATGTLASALERDHGDNGTSFRELADSDPLTGMPNRRAFERRLHEEIERARRHESVLTLVMLDLDHFKQINDTHGHQFGDQVLRQSAQLLRRELRAVDFLARIGGEEFVILLPETGITGARIFIDRLLRRLALHEFTAPAGRESVRVTCSAGIAAFPDDRVATGNDLVSVADDNLYRAKQDGRNRYRD